MEAQHFAAQRNLTSYDEPRNLTLALVTETGELSELIQWEGDSDNNALIAVEKEQKILIEIADITIYSLRLALFLGLAQDIENIFVEIKEP